MQKNSASINLLKKQTSLIDRFVNWALTIGRLLVILTEIVALSAFIYRFSLDRQLIDLHSKITQEQAIVNYLKDNEKTYRNLQDRLFIATTYSSLGVSRFKVFRDIVSFAPLGMTFNNVTLHEDRIKIDANADSVSSLNIFVNSVKNYSEIDSVSIDKIENKPSSAVIVISLTATLKPSVAYANTN
ncbi:MAG: hypothetical protein M1405_02405 [Patescibacteria group bacterium]|nr:hypothetical protein [Patescibacteria group bacterium]